jgi:proline iminopeptidase
VPSAAVNATDLHYEVDGAGRPCLVLHGGLGMDHTRYRRTLGPLSPPLQLVYLDHRGTGRSGRPPLDTLTMPQLADDAVGLADHLGLDRFLVFGHSYGGFVAQELAIRHPDRVDGVVLVSTTAGQLGTAESEDDTEAGPPLPPAFAAAMSTPPTSDDGYAAGMADLLPHYLHQADVDAVRTIEDETVWSASAMLRGFQVLSAWSAIDRLPQVRCPVLLVAGRHDVVTSFPQAHRIARHLPDAEVVVLEHSAHYPWFDEPDEFFAAVHGWLAARFG